jgi:hypothetical protein
VHDFLQEKNICKTREICIYAERFRSAWIWVGSNVATFVAQHVRRETGACVTLLGEEGFSEA